MTQSAQLRSPIKQSLNFCLFFTYFHLFVHLKGLHIILERLHFLWVERLYDGGVSTERKDRTGEGGHETEEFAVQESHLQKCHTHRGHSP